MLWQRPALQWGFSNLSGHSGESIYPSSPGDTERFAPTRSWSWGQWRGASRLECEALKTGQRSLVGVGQRVGTVEGRARGHIQREEAARSLKTQRSCKVTAVASMQGEGVGTAGSQLLACTYTGSLDD